MVLLYTVGSLGKGSPYEQGAPVGCGMWGVDMKLSEMELRVKHEGRERVGSCTVGADVIRKEAWPFYRTISGIR